MACGLTVLDLSKFLHSPWQWLSGGSPVYVDMDVDPGNFNLVSLNIQLSEFPK